MKDKDLTTMLVIALVVMVLGFFLLVNTNKTTDVRTSSYLEDSSGVIVDGVKIK